MVTNNEKLVKDVKAVVADAEAMLRETTGKTSKELTELRASMSERLETAKARLIEAEEAMVDKAKEAAKRLMSMCMRTLGSLPLLQGALVF